MLHRYDPAYLYVDARLRANWSLVVDPLTGTIAAVGERSILARQYPTIAVSAWPERLLMPGTVNLHAHAFQHLARGRGVDRPFLTWRDQALYHITPQLNPETLYLGAKFAFAEMLQAGITTVAEFFYVHGANLDNDRAVIQAARDVGIRLVFARTFYDWDGAPASYRETLDDAVTRTQILSAELTDDPCTTLHIAPHSLHGASDDMIRTAVALADDLHVPFHIHVAEEAFEVDAVKARTGHTPVEHLADLGALSPQTIAVHLVCLTPDDVRRVAASGAAWAYCPSSNMFLADGIAPLPDLMSLGVRAGLGTDGGCSNNRASVFEEMRMAALLYKVVHQNAAITDYHSVLEMGTRTGAKILRVPTGTLEAGLWADFLGINLRHRSLVPWTEKTLMPNIVYSMQPQAVQDVIVGGRPVVADGMLLTTDGPRLVDKMQTLVNGWAGTNTES